MAPFYRGWDPFLKLSEDDKRAIRSLYGRNLPKPPTSSRNNPTPGPSFFRPVVPTSNGVNICNNPKIDAIFQTADTSSYIFQNDNYWKLTKDSVAPGYPRKIAQDWPGLPSNIDAAFTWHKSKATYFLKGSKYWKFENMRPKSGYPKDIRDGFPGIPAGVDVAFVWGGNGKIYFFKGSQYWKFDPERKPHVRSDHYPKAISLWDLPNDMDGALQWDNGRTYFFKSGDYWRFNDRQFTVDRGDPAFPRPTAHWWFGCPQSKQLKAGKPKPGDSVVALIRKDNLNNEIESDEEYDFIGDYDLVEPIHK